MLSGRQVLAEMELAPRYEMPAREGHRSALDSSETYDTYTGRLVRHAINGITLDLGLACAQYSDSFTLWLALEHFQERAEPAYD